MFFTSGIKMKRRGDEMIRIELMIQKVQEYLMEHSTFIVRTLVKMISVTEAITLVKPFMTDLWALGKSRSVRLPARL